MFLIRKTKTKKKKKIWGVDCSRLTATEKNVTLSLSFVEHKDKELYFQFSKFTGSVQALKLDG